MTFSYATERKIRIIRETLGEDWETKTSGRSIDAVYNEVVGDGRKNLFCKIRPEAKARLDEMVDEYDVKMAELVEQLIDNEYRRFLSERDSLGSELMNQFTR